MHDKIYEIFLNVNDALKFAETKNSGLIILCSGLILGLAATFKEISDKINRNLLGLAALSFVVSISISLISFFPVLSNNTEPLVRNVENFYFFGTLCEMDSQCFVDEIIKVDPTFKPTKFDVDMINQIVVNSDITMSKMILFRWALLFCFIGILILSTSVAARFFRKHK